MALRDEMTDAGRQGAQPLDRGEVGYEIEPGPRSIVDDHDADDEACAG